VPTTRQLLTVPASLGSSPQPQEILLYTKPGGILFIIFSGIFRK